MQSNYHDHLWTDSSKLDHDYGMEPLWPGFEPMDPLAPEFDFDIQSLDSTAIESYDDAAYDFASAPTPHMANQHIEDLEEEIDTDDLMSAIEVEVATHSLQIIGEAEVMNDAPPSTPCSLPDVNNNVKTTRQRKRKIESLYDEDSDDESVATVSTKGRPGRKPSKGSKCMSRNAIAARENREKKKAYIDNMERKLKNSEDENRRLKTQVNSLQNENHKLTEEVGYFKGVLANDSTISSLIKHMMGANQIELVGTQFVELSKASGAAPAADTKPVRKSHRIASTKGDTSPTAGGHSSGICLHIHNKKVSLELCPKCSQKHSRKGK